jgi:hypothetical protein
MRCSIAILTITISAFSSPHASACCLTNWLCGRPATPYVVGYAPVGYAPVAAPVVVPVPVAAPCAANYPVATTSVLPPTSNVAVAVPNRGVYQAQRPAYFDNPSVYTGMPVTGVYQAARVPVANYRGVAPGRSGYLGAANQYPTNYTAAYAAAQVPVTVAPGLPVSVVTPMGIPATALPATQVAPLYAPTPVQQPSGLSRFFGSTHSTNYRSSYSRTPVTYYRPATTMDPISGTTVTVQRPCTSYVQQLQRTPYGNLQAPGAAYVQPAPAPGCNSPACGNSFSAAPSPLGYGTQVPSSIGQASAVSPLGLGQFGPGQFGPGQLTVPIPSTSPAPSAGGFAPNYATPNNAPLTGVPGGGSGTRSGVQQAPGDQAPLDQPELRNRPATNQNGSGQESETEQGESDHRKPESYWKLQNADDSTAMIRDSQPTQYQAQPIIAPDDYVSPYRRQPQSPTTPVTSRSPDIRRILEAPPLPARSFDSVEKSQDLNWVSAPVREASAVRPSQNRRPLPKPIQRDTSWKPARR